MPVQQTYWRHGWQDILTARLLS